ncbi:MAG TPA: glycosyltransferase family 4 protein [Saprospiraceae bacterium]|nr:glycosyltransferase family 4 protein [Saprospiraceae bacterium]
MKQANTKPIHYVLWDLGPGGMELNVLQYIDHFYGHSKMEVYGLRATENTLFDESKVKVICARNNPGNTYWKYWQYCRSNRKDIFHLNNGGPVILLITLLAGVQNPIYHIHGTIYWKSAIQKVYLKFVWFFIRILLTFRKITFVANSHYSEKVFRDNVLKVKPLVIYNGIDTGRFYAHFHPRKRLKKMAYVGRLHPGKNVELVIRLFEEIAADHPQLELHIAGSGPLQEAIRKQCDASPFHQRIICHGFISDIERFYGEVDLFLFLSAFESFGNVLVEALLTGLPVLTSDIPAFREIYGEHHIFELGKPENYNNIKQRFIQAVRTYPVLASKPLTMIEELKHRFSQQNHVDQINALYVQM